MQIRVDIFTKSRDLPEINSNNLFQSKTMFALYENTPGMRPYMAVAFDEAGNVAGHLLASICRRKTWIPPFIYNHGVVLGCGDSYSRDNKDSADNTATENEIFGKLLSALTFKLRSCTSYIEFCNMSRKMFGYRQFRNAGYFPVHWMSVSNSLHSMPPEERLSEKTKKRIEKSYNRGLLTEEVRSDNDIDAFYKLLRSHSRMKPRRYVPHISFFKGLQKCKNARMFITKYKNKAIGCYACAFYDGNAYLWYSAFLRKSFALLHPDTMTVWHAIKYAYDNNCSHIVFMNVGLPFRRNHFREFILKFGGKPIGTYRWFRCSNKIINKILSRIYRD